MAREKFTELLSKYCEKQGITASAPVLEGTSLVVKGISYQFDYREQGPDGHILIYCDFGPLPDLRKEDVFRVLMAINFQLFVGQGTGKPRLPGTFTYSPATKHVMLTHSYSLGILTLEGLGTLIELYSGLAKDWRKDYFLPPQENTPFVMPSQFNGSQFQRYI